MAYQLEYSFEHFKKTHYKEKKYNIILTALLIACVAISIHLGGAGLEVVLFGNREQLHTSATQMVEDLRSGSPLEDAVYTFCEGVINAEDSY